MANIDNSLLRQDLLARPRQEALRGLSGVSLSPEWWTKGPLGSHSQTSLRPLGSFREFPGLALPPAVEPRVLGAPPCSLDDT